VGSRDLEGGRIRAACRIFGTGCVSITGRYQSCRVVLATELGPQTLSSSQRCMFFLQNKTHLEISVERRNCVFNRKSHQIINSLMLSKLTQSHAKKLESFPEKKLQSIRMKH